MVVKAWIIYAGAPSLQRRTGDIMRPAFVAANCSGYSMKPNILSYLRKLSEKWCVRTEDYIGHADWLRSAYEKQHSLHSTAQHSTA